MRALAAASALLLASAALAEGPHLTSLIPDNASAGGSGLVILVNGATFQAGSVARWNGADRPTSLVSSSQLQVVVSAQDISTGAVANVTVFTPGPLGGLSNQLSFTINNPAPTLTSLSPKAGRRGAARLTLNLTGAGFSGASRARVGGGHRATAFLDEAHLSVTLAAADLAAPGALSIEVYNPPPGGGLSNALVFSVGSPGERPSSEAPQTGPTSLASRKRPK